VVTREELMGLNRRTRWLLWALPGISAIGLLPAACAPQPWIVPPPANDAKLPVWTPPPPPPPPATEAERASLRALRAELCPSDPGDSKVLSAPAYKWLHWPGCRITDRKLMILEHQLLHQLLEKMARDDPHRPWILHRLAGGHFSQEERFYRHCRGADAPESATSREVEARKAEVIKWKQEVVKEQNEGFRYCARLRAEHPDHQSINSCPTEPGAVPQP
jgi:hypothetical protein